MNNQSPLACGFDLTSFKPSTITLVEGPSKFVPDLLLYLCTHNRHQQDVVFVDGGNSFNPYTLRSISKVLQAGGGELCIFIVNDLGLEIC